MTPSRVSWVLRRLRTLISRKVPMKATEMIAGVQAGKLQPLQMVEDALQRVRANAHLAAIQDVYASEARAAAQELAQRQDLAQLPLAGLPVLVKNNIPVAGHPLRNGSPATSATPAARDHVVVQRLREAGAIIIASTTVPELCLWATCDSTLDRKSTRLNSSHVAI